MNTSHAEAMHTSSFDEKQIMNRFNFKQKDPSLVAMFTLKSAHHGKDLKLTAQSCVLLTKNLHYFWTFMN